MRGWAAFVVWVVLLALLAGCGNETDDNAKETGEGGPANEETRFVTQMVTVEETAPSGTTDESADSQDQSPEDVLALQYEYINRGDFEQAYSLFAGQSQRRSRWSSTGRSSSPTPLLDNRLLVLSCTDTG